MKAISLWQPWASLIAIGAKPFETRDWAPPWSLVGQRIAIHAAKRPLKPIVRDMDPAVRDAIVAALTRGGYRLPFGDPPVLPLGAVVCTAVIVGARKVDEDFQAPDLFGNYSLGRWIWRIKHVRRLDVPMPFRGAQGFFEVPALEVRGDGK